MSLDTVKCLRLSNPTQEGEQQYLINWEHAIRYSLLSMQKIFLPERNRKYSVNITQWRYPSVNQDRMLFGSMVPLEWCLFYFLVELTILAGDTLRNRWKTSMLNFTLEKIAKWARRQSSRYLVKIILNAQHVCVVNVSYYGHQRVTIVTNSWDNSLDQSLYFMYKMER